MKKTAIYLLLLCFPIVLPATKNTITINDKTYDKNFFETYSDELNKAFAKEPGKSLNHGQCRQRVAFFNRYKAYPDLLSATVDNKYYASSIDITTLRKTGDTPVDALVLKLVQYAPKTFEARINGLKPKNRDTILKYIGKDLEKLSYSILKNIPTTCTTLCALAARALEAKKDALVAQLKNASKDQLEVFNENSPLHLQAAKKVIKERLILYNTTQLETIPRALQLHRYVAISLLVKYLAQWTQENLEKIPKTYTLHRLAALALIEQRLENAPTNYLELIPQNYPLHRFAAQQVIEARLKPLPIQQLTQIPSQYPLHQQVAMKLLKNNFQTSIN